MNIELNHHSGLLLEALATEDGLSKEDFLSNLLYHEDVERHVVWNRKTMTHERSKCPRASCRELQAISPSDSAS